ncbi:transglutaminase-like domain-containing protein [Spirosoma oryzicola]|uniref:transglutaminase-like domain-containing protein n=1 Tax=Spirosoma oryzicola TaxID=2898794 RepID=UPI001E61EAA6|nr:transglutaminase domain-containing protein [Spirosoma oryzicola]UHG94727.1 hypothetical protein LQ777_28720 [Spirosoma oryzicola]
MMRSLLIGLAMIWLTWHAVGQTTSPQNEFRSYSAEQNKVINQLVTHKQYRQAIEHCDDWYKIYAQLNEAVKRQFAGLPADLFYGQACLYGLLKDKAGATRAFQKAVAAGYKNYRQALTDPDLAYARTDKEFVRQLALIRRRGDYRFILQQDTYHSPRSRTDRFGFTYQSADEPQLVALRHDYKLDSIAGQGSDVSKVINLMQWVHDRIPHDGNNENPVSRNAQDLLTVCQQQARGLNCRGLSTVLNEVYLAMGFRSHFVGCLPKDTSDSDSHVINSVYVPSIRKWLYMDPTQAAYLMNEAGQLLSISEVRQRLIEGRPLLLNPTANWNHKVSATKVDYLDRYMAKNLYQLERPLTSQRDLETRQEGKVLHYVRLVPLKSYNAQRATQIKRGKLVTIVTHYTSDPTVFWAVN